MLFHWFKKKRNTDYIDFSRLKVDMHSHLIPGIDDGAQHIDESMQLILRLKSMGFQKCITTPHIMAGVYNNSPNRILTGLKSVESAVNKANIDFTIEASAEYYFDESLQEKLDKNELLLVQGKYCLMEFSFLTPPFSVENLLGKLVAKGITPIIAHPERYPYWYKTPEQYKYLKDLGCDLQLNTLSLTGYYGKAVQKVAADLIERQWIDFLGSDMHHIRHATALEHAPSSSLVREILEGYPLKNELLLN